jgi:hypothetical protein
MKDEEIFDGLSAARFENAQTPQGLPVVSAIDAVKKWISETPESDRPQHIIILTGRTDEEGVSRHRFFQAGSYGAHSQFGLLYCGLEMLNEAE